MNCFTKTKQWFDSSILVKNNIKYIRHTPLLKYELGSPVGVRNAVINGMLVCLLLTEQTYGLFTRV